MDGVAERWEVSRVEQVFRDVYGQAVATLVRVFGDISLAEDAVQDAFLVASDRWPRTGIPPNPAGWIITTARNRAIDTLRRSKRGAELVDQLVPPAASSVPADTNEEETMVRDDQLRLIFTCCHPALRPEHQVALTLRLLGGLTVGEVARSFLVSESAMEKRLVRARYKIKAANIPYRIPPDSELPHRLRSVLSVVYLIYNSGADDPDRGALRHEAIRFGRALGELMPDEPEVAGLLGLMLLNDARVPARAVGGAVVLLRDQDRTRWDRAMIDEGHTIIRACIRRDRPGPFQVQAAIQAVHCAATSYEETDWHQIVALYDQLLEMQPTPIVIFNRAIAVGEVEGPDVALAALDSVAADLDTYHLLHAARGASLRRLGRLEAAKLAYLRAVDLAVTVQDRQFLIQQIEEFSGDK